MSLFENCRSQFLLDRLGSCFKLFVSTDSTSSNELASQFGLAIVLYAKNTHKVSRRPGLAQVYVTECAGHVRSIANDNSDHRGAILSQTGDIENLYIHDLINVVYE